MKNKESVYGTLTAFSTIDAEEHYRRFIFNDTNMIQKAKRNVDSLSKKKKAELIQLVEAKELIIENLTKTIGDMLEENERIQYELTQSDEWIDTALIVGIIGGVFLLGIFIGLTVGSFIF
jgi:lipoate-protein ligase A